MSHPPPTPPIVDQRELRPSRVWYWVAAAVVVAGVCVGPALTAVGLYSIFNALPQRMDATFEAGSAEVVRLSADRRAAIYLANPDAPEQVEVTCQGSAVDGGSIQLTRFRDTVTFLAEGKRWQMVYRITVSETGAYQLHCAWRDPAAATGHFGVTDDVDPRAFAGRAFGSIGALFGVPCAALFAGGVIALVAGLRRSAHKKRLLRERTGPPAVPRPPGHPAGGPGSQPPGEPPSR